MLLFLRDLRDAFSLQRIQIASYHRTDQHATRTTAAEINVLPIEMVFGDLFLQTLARRRIAQAREHLFRAAFERPRRQTRTQRRTAGDVRINISANVEAAVTRLFDAVEDLRHATPVLLVRGFEVPDLDRDFRLFRDLKML